MVFSLQDIKKNIKNNMATLKLFLISATLQLPVHLGMFLVVGMSTDSGMNEMSVYKVGDLFCLIFMSFIPIFLFIIYGQFIPLLIIVNSRLKEMKNKSKDKKYNMKLYMILLIIQSAPYILMLFALHSNFDIDYRKERISQIKWERGEMVEGYENIEKEME